MANLHKERLTNEDLSKLFNDNFQLANRAIKLAQRHIHAGEDWTLARIFDELRRNPDMTFEEVSVEKEEEGEESYPS